MNCATSLTTFDALPRNAKLLRTIIMDEIESHSGFERFLAGIVDRIREIGRCRKISSARTIGMGKTFSSDINVGNVWAKFLMTCRGMRLKRRTLIG